MKRLAVILTLGLIIACSCHTVRQVSRTTTSKDTTGRNVHTEHRVRLSGSLQLDHSTTIKAETK